MPIPKGPERGVMTDACALHDRVNLYLLPVLGTMCIASLLGHFDTDRVTHIFMGYILLDAVWITAVPQSLPSLRGVILGHHLVTFLLLLFPFFHPAFAHFTSLDGVTELNTFFLIARRQWHEHRQLMHWCYWLSFIPMRLVLYPALLVKFWVVLEGFPLWKRLGVCTCQFLLCLFNYGMLYLSVQRRRKTGRSGASTAALQKAGARVEGIPSPGGKGPAATSDIVGRCPTNGEGLQARKAAATNGRGGPGSEHS